MAAVTVSVASPGSPHRFRLKAQLVAETGAAYTLRSAPRLELGNVAARFANNERVGRKPTLRVAGQNLRTVSMTFPVVGRDYAGNYDWVFPVEDDLHMLRDFARRGFRFQFRNYGPSYAGWYRITDFSQKDVVLQDTSNKVTAAEITVTATEASDPLANVGPLTGGATTATPPPSSGAPPGAQTYTVQAGDTLYGIALKFYQNGDLYPKIADANSLANPNQITVGQRLVIPPK